MVGWGHFDEASSVFGGSGSAWELATNTFRPSGHFRHLSLAVSDTVISYGSDGEPHRSSLSLDFP